MVALTLLWEFAVSLLRLPAETENSIKGSKLISQLIMAAEYATEYRNVPTKKTEKTSVKTWMTCI